MFSKFKRRTLAWLLTTTFTVGSALSGGFSCSKVSAAKTAMFSYSSFKDAPIIPEPGDIPEVRNALNESIKAFKSYCESSNFYVFEHDAGDAPLKDKYRNPVIPNCYEKKDTTQPALSYFKLKPSMFRPGNRFDAYYDANAREDERIYFYDYSEHEYKLNNNHAQYDDLLDKLNPKLSKIKDKWLQLLFPAGDIQSKADWDACGLRKTTCGLRVVLHYGVNAGYSATGRTFLTDEELPLSNLSLDAFGEYLKQLVNANPNYTPDELFDNQSVRQKLDDEFGYFYYDASIMEKVSEFGNNITSAIKSLASKLSPNSNNGQNVQLNPFLAFFGLRNGYSGSNVNSNSIGINTGYNCSPSINWEMREHGIHHASEIALRFYYSDVASWGTRAARKIRSTAGYIGVATPVAMAGAVAWKLFDWTTSQIGKLLTKGASVATDEFLRERNKLLNDPVKLRDAIKRMMQQGVVGLRDTIDSLTTLVTGSLALRKCEGLLNKNHCQLIAFVGPPGTGKSLLAQKYAIALTGKPIPNWGYITSASIKPGVPPAEQFFNSESDLIKNLKKSNGNTVIFIDEIDKFDSNDLLEKLRDAVDKGTIVATSENTETRPGMTSTTTSKVVKTESVNVTGLIVIVGSNEKPECWGLEPDPDKPEYNVGRTVVERSGSLVQRFQRFKFNPYNQDEYKQMYENALNAIRPECVNMFGLPVEFDDNLTTDLAKESVHRLMGGRSVPIVLSEMAGAITSFNISTVPESDGFLSRIKDLMPERIVNLFKSKKKGVKLKVSFDSNTHKFVVTEEQISGDDELEEGTEQSSDETIPDEKLDDTIAPEAIPAA